MSLTLAVLEEDKRTKRYNIMECLDFINFFSVPVLILARVDVDSYCKNGYLDLTTNQRYALWIASRQIQKEFGESKGLKHIQNQLMNGGESVEAEETPATTIHPPGHDLI